MHDKTVRDF